jgi:hypothetical protein
MSEQFHPTVTGDYCLTGLYNAEPNQIDITLVSGFLPNLDSKPKWFGCSVVSALMTGLMTGPARGRLSGGTLANLILISAGFSDRLTLSVIIPAEIAFSFLERRNFHEKVLVRFTTVQ